MPSARAARRRRRPIRPAPTSSRSDARISEKWRPCGLTRNRSPDWAYRDAEMVADPFMEAEPRRPAEGCGQIDALLPDLVRFHGPVSPPVASRRLVQPARVRSILAGSSKGKRSGGNSAIRLIRTADAVLLEYPYQGSRHERSGFPRRSCPDHRRSGNEHRDAVGHAEETRLPPTLLGQRPLRGDRNVPADSATSRPAGYRDAGDWTVSASWPA